MRIAIVPQLVPVAKEVSDATTKTSAGNQSGDTTSLSIDAINVPVNNLSQLAFMPQAHNIIAIGNNVPESPPLTALPISGKDILENARPHIIAAKNAVIAAEASILTFSAFESASRHAVSE